MLPPNTKSPSASLPVLEDPVYRNKLSGRWRTSASSSAATECVLVAGGAERRWSEAPVLELIDVSERFGLDNEGKDGWARVDFELLSTSKGSRSPQLRPLFDGKKGDILRPKRNERSELWGGQGGLSSPARDLRRKVEIFEQWLRV